MERTGVNREILIAAAQNQLEKIPSPLHPAVLLPHADSHVLDPPRSTNPWSFYPCFDHRVIASRFKKPCRPRQCTSVNPSTPSTPKITRAATVISTMPSPAPSPPSGPQDGANINSTPAVLSDAAANSGHGSEPQDGEKVRPQDLSDGSTTSSEENGKKDSDSNYVNTPTHSQQKSPDNSSSESTDADSPESSSKGQDSAADKSAPDEGRGGTGLQPEREVHVLHDLICSLDDAKAHPTDITKHNRVKDIIKSVDLHKL